MKHRVVALIAAAGVALVVPVITDAKPVPKASVAYCTYGRIGGHIKCLRRGEYCARRYERQYERYGFTCSKLDRRRRWHLQ